MAPKRKAPETPEGTASQRRSTRISSSGKKSRYFEDESVGEEEYSASTASAKSRTKAKAAPKSRSRTARSKPRSPEPDPDEEDDDEYDNDGNGTPVQDAADEEDDDDDSDAPPKITYIPLPKLRDTGGIPYEDDRLHRNTLLFLKDLKANNKRSWLKSHDQEFRRALSDFSSYAASLTGKLIEADATVPELPLKDVIFRIYRDTRFSRDPTPYKPHFSAAWSRTGRKGPYAVYYLHVQPDEEEEGARAGKGKGQGKAKEKGEGELVRGGPGGCFVGGGLYFPPAEPLARLRASIDERPRRWRRVLGEGEFRRTFLDGREDGDVEDAVREFVKRNQEGALKTKPKGFNSDHRDIELLKLKSFTVGKKIPDSVLTDENGQDEIARIFGALVGFITHLNSIVMPDPGQDDDSEDDEDEDDEDE